MKRIFLFLVFTLGFLPNIIAQTCDCKEYIYLNEPEIGAVLKFQVNTGTVALTELIGANGGTPPAQHWYPGTGTSVLLSHMGSEQT